MIKPQIATPAEYFMRSLFHPVSARNQNHSITDWYDEPSGTDRFVVWRHWKDEGNNLFRINIAVTK